MYEARTRKIEVARMTRHGAKAWIVNKVTLEGWARPTAVGTAEVNPEDILLGDRMLVGCHQQDRQQTGGQETPL
jgi:hypothetical protein